MELGKRRWKWQGIWSDRGKSWRFLWPRHAVIAVRDSHDEERAAPDTVPDVGHNACLYTQCRCSDRIVTGSIEGDGRSTGSLFARNPSHPGRHLSVLERGV